MNKVINGRRYDTETATRMAEWENIKDHRDFSYYIETLYRKANGEYFLHGKGGPRSKYCEIVGVRERAAGEQIIPLSYQEAQEWAECLSGDEYEAIFGAVDETTVKKNITISITTSDNEIIKRLAAQNNISISDMVSKLIRQVDTDREEN